MDKITNKAINPVDESSLHLYGIVYFKNKPYNNDNYFNQEVYGMLKLDKLENVSNDNFRTNFTSRGFGVLDVRGVDKNSYG